MQFWATWLQLADKSPPSNREIFFRLDLSISCNFKQLCSSWQKSPLPNRDIFLRLDLSISWFHAISSNFASSVRKDPPTPQPNPPKQGKVLDWICPFHAILSNFASSVRKDPPTPQPNPPKQGKVLDWICPFHAILSNFASAGRKPPPHHPQNRELFYTGSIHFMQFQATLLQLVEKYPPQEQGKFFRMDLSISCNFKQLCFSWQKVPSLEEQGNFLDWIYPFHAILSNFGFRWQKSPPPPLFCLFMTDPACITHVEYSFTLRFLLSRYLL